MKHYSWCSPTQLLQRDTLTEESWYGYHHAHYEAKNEGYQDDDDERLHIDVHGDLLSAHTLMCQKKSKL